MKSVGILCPSYTLLYRYMHFLENQVRSDPLLCRVRTRRLRAITIISQLSSFLPTFSVMCPALVTAPLFSHPLNMNKETQLQLLSYTQRFCAEALTASPPFTILLLSLETSLYLLTEHGYIRNAVTVG